MAGLIGTIGPFTEDESWEAYVERLLLYFQVNDIADDKRLPAFLSIIGSQTYGVLKSLVSPTPPSEKTLQQCIDVLKANYCPKPLVIVERFRFMKRYQVEGETVLKYNTQLKQLSSTCDFGETLSERLRDQQVVGIRSEAIQRRLLAETALTYNKAIELATSMELADKDSKELIGSAKSAVNYVARRGEKPSASSSGGNRKMTTSPCYHCGGTNHKPDQCRYANAVCHQCNKKGHLQRVCRSKKVYSDGRTPFKKKSKTRPRDPSSVHHVEDQHETYQLYTVDTEKDKPSAFWAMLKVNGKELRMEIDTGASVSIISEETLRECFEDIPIEDTSSTLRTYTGEIMPTMGTAHVEVEYEGQQERLPLLVVAGSGPTLLGRNWLRKLTLNWREIYRMSTDNTLVMSADTLLQRYPELLKSTIGTIHGVKGHFQVDHDAEPRFCKPRNVPYALREKVDQELTRLGRRDNHTSQICRLGSADSPSAQGKRRECANLR